MDEHSQETIDSSVSPRTRSLLSLSDDFVIRETTPPDTLNVTTLHCLSNAWILTDDRGCIIQTNHIAQTLFQYTNLTGVHIEQLMPPSVAHHHHRYMDTYHKTHHSRLIGSAGREVDILRADGTFKTVLLQVSRIPNGFFAMLIDVRNVPKIHAQHTQLVQASRCVEQLGQLLQYINHDVRAHLTNIDLIIGQQLPLLMQPTTNARIPSQIARITHTLATVLELSELYQQKYQFCVDQLNYIELMEETLGAYLTLNLQKDIQFTATFPPEMRYYDIHADATKLGAALHALVRFFVQHRADRVECTTTCTPHAHQMTVVTRLWGNINAMNEVECQQLLNGIAPSTHSTDPYTCLHLPAVAQILAQGHKGSLACESDSFGLTFTISMNVATAARTDPIDDTRRVFSQLHLCQVPSTIDGEFSSDDGSGSAGTYNVLVVDDSELTRKLVIHTLRRLHYTAHSVANGRACLEWLRTNTCEVILMDRTMPLLDGLETTRQVKQQWPDVCVVGLTGDTASDQLEEFRQAGAFRILCKPLNIPHLTQVLDELFSD